MVSHTFKVPCDERTGYYAFAVGLFLMNKRALAVIILKKSNKGAKPTATFKKPKIPSNRIT